MSVLRVSLRQARRLTLAGNCGLGEGSLHVAHKIISAATHAYTATRTATHTSTSAHTHVVVVRVVQRGIVTTMLLIAHDLAQMNFHHALAHGVDDFLIMGSHHNRRVRCTVDGIQNLHNSHRSGRIEVTRWLVGQKNLRVVHISAGDSHTLSLTTGKLVRKTIFHSC